MNIEMMEGWNASGSHDSSYDEVQVKALIAQACDLPGVSNAKDHAKMPERIQLFVKNCLVGDTTIWVMKGIHQRWDRIKADGEVTKNADPHIQVKFGHRFGSAPTTWIAIHVRLSEEQQRVRTLRSGTEVIDCAWKTVGLSC